MTNPIALLTPLPAPDPAAAPAPGEDAALVTAAFIGALQAAMLPAFAPAVPAAPPTAASSDGDVQQPNDAPNEQRPEPPVAEESGAQSPEPRPPVQTATASPKPRFIDPRLGQAPVPGGEPSTEAPQRPSGLTSDVEVSPRGLGASFTPSPVNEIGGNLSPRRSADAEHGQVSPLAGRASRPALPSQCNREAGLADVAVPPPELPPEATPVAAVVTSTVVSAAADLPRDEERGSDSQPVVSPSVVTAVVMPIPAPASVLPARVPDSGAAPSETAGRGAVELPAPDPGAAAGASGRRASPIQLPRREAPPATRWPTIGSAAATSSEAGFTRALTEIVGDAAAISDLRVRVIEGNGPATAPPDRVPTEATVSARVSRQAPVAPTPVQSLAVGGEAAVVGAAVAPNFSSSRSGESPDRELPAPATVDGDVPKRQESEPPRLTRAEAPRGVPEPIPFVDRRTSRVTERTLPAARQELPVQAERSQRDPAPSRAAARDESSPPSDGRGGGSASPLAQSGPGTRGEVRSPQSTNGEARNLPKEIPTREQPAGLADRVTLQVADADGRQTRIRVAVLGDQVRAVIQPPDGEAARHLERRMDELQAALVRQGFVDPKVTVQLAASSAETAAPWGSAPASGPTDPPLSRGTDQPPGDQRQGTGRREQGRQGDGQRHPQERSPERDPQDRRR